MFKSTCYKQDQNKNNYDCIWRLTLMHSRIFVKNNTLVRIQPVRRIYGTMLIRDCTCTVCSSGIHLESNMFINEGKSIFFGDYNGDG
jgi:hypothetical protein